MLLIHMHHAPDIRTARIFSYGQYMIYDFVLPSLAAPYYRPLFNPEVENRELLALLPTRSVAFVVVVVIVAADASVMADYFNGNLFIDKG